MLGQLEARDETVLSPAKLILAAEAPGGEANHIILQPTDATVLVPTVATNTRSFARTPIPSQHCYECVSHGEYMTWRED
jgi:hypothetical protein